MSEYTNENDAVGAMDAVGYLKTLFLPGDTLDVLLIHQESRVVHNNFSRLEDAATQETIESIGKAQQDGWNVYVVMNALQPGAQHRRKQDVQAIRSFYIDVDENGQTAIDAVLEDVEAGFVPDPSFVLRSSPEKCYIVWLVQGFTVEQAEAMNKALQQRYHADPAATDVSRVLRLPGTRNLKYPDQPVVEIVYQTEHERYTHDDFHLPAVEPEAEPEVSIEEPANSEKVPDEGFLRLFEAVGWSPLIKRMNRMDDERFHELDLEPGKLTFCPMPGHQPRDKHANYMPVFGPLKETPELLHCFGCRWSGDLVKTIREFDGGEDGGQRHYVDMYACAQQICLEEGLRFEDFFPEPTVPATADRGLPVEDDPIEQIPEFDPSCMTGCYEKFVELATRNTTLTPQFVFLAAKTIVCALASFRFIKFENLEGGPRHYAMFIGESGSGKGEAYRRAMKVFQSGLQGLDIKIFNSADSGAGLKDVFFTESGDPINKPCLCYIDELKSFGNKTADNRNPGIMDTLIELADCTSVSRILSRRGGPGSEKTNDNAQLSVISCAQNGDVIARAFAGRTEVGIYDRWTPEFAVPVEGGDLPEIDRAEASLLLQEIAGLLGKAQESGMTTSPEAKAVLDGFWKAQPKPVRTRVRWRRDLWMDAYMTALGDGRMVVGPEDMQVAIKIFQRQQTLRAIFFGSEISDRIGFYLSKIKQKTEWMRRRLEAGANPELVALSKRDYEKMTNASRDNEEHIFAKAFQTHMQVHLRAVTVIKTNGQRYAKFLPLEDDEQAA